MVVAVVMMEGKRKDKFEEGKGEGSAFPRMWDEGPGPVCGQPAGGRQDLSACPGRPGTLPPPGTKDEELTEANRSSGAQGPLRLCFVLFTFSLCLRGPFISIAINDGWHRYRS